MELRRKISIFIGLAQSLVGAFATVFAYVLYSDLFQMQTVLNVPQTDSRLYMLILIIFGLLSIISGLFLLSKQ